MNDSKKTTIASNSGADMDAVVVGAGFAGLYMLYKLREMGLDARVYESGDGVGGTWYWNRYPGARCDVPSFEYSYSFDPRLEQEWDWSELYPSQPEILAYIEHVAQRHDLYRDIVFNTRITTLAYDESQHLWRFVADNGQEKTARFAVLAVGPLSVPVIPDFPGLDSFKGTIVHTGRWPKAGIDVNGKRVAVIGSGSSAIQVSPELAKTADRVFMLQRSPAYSVPSRNRPLTATDILEAKSNYPAIRARAQANRSALGFKTGEQSALEVDDQTREQIYEERWQGGGLAFTGAFHDIFTDTEANKTAGDFVRKKIREMVEDQSIADHLMPETLIGCKRLCVDNGYLPMFNRDNVELVDLRERPIQHLTENSVCVGNDQLPIDVLVLATGFDAITGAQLKMDIAGRNGLQLKDKWQEGPKNYLGLAVEGFPNLFMVSGPGSPAGLANMVTLAEQNVDVISGLIHSTLTSGASAIEALADAETNWVKHVNELASETIYPLANSWYVGANVPGKPRIFMPHLDYPLYRRRCEEVISAGCEGFRLQ